MPVSNIDQSIALGLSHHQRGQLDAAAAIYRSILDVNPHHPVALHLLGVVCHESENHSAAVDLIRRAIAIDCNAPDYHSNLGLALTALGLLLEAESEFRSALKLRPSDAEDHHNLGVALYRQGKIVEAIAEYETALSLNPSSAKTCNNLGNALVDQGNLSLAVDAYRKAVQLHPKLAQAYYNLGNALTRMREFDQAIQAYRLAVHLHPRWPEALLALGGVLQTMGKHESAAAAYRESLRWKPESVEALNDLGTVLVEMGDLDGAVQTYQKVLAAHPTLSEAYHNLGNVCRELGLMDEAISSYRTALELRPDAVHTHSNLAYALHFHADSQPRDIYEEHSRWNQRHAVTLRKDWRPHDNDRSASRRLRLGYVSPDFRRHPIGRFLLPILQNHNQEQFEIFCYSDVRTADAITDQLREEADHWRNTADASDAELAERIRSDRIDVLVDLTMHMKGNRLLMFARKPAPVQITYLAYCSTTGLDAIDYRLTDPYLDPPDSGASHYSETSLWLAQSYWCYAGAGPEISPNRRLAAGDITFGCLNNFSKVTPRTLAAWRKLLRDVPRSRLLLHAPHGSPRQRVRDFFSDDVDASRIEFLGRMANEEYFRAYDRIDIALDPFPYPGGTTTCDALWMGVPVVSLAGQTAVSRAGLSLLSNVGLSELVGTSVDRYLTIAAELAADIDRLHDLRSTLRSRLRASVLMDTARFVQNLGNTYRQAWRNWCGCAPD